MGGQPLTQFPEDRQVVEPSSRPSIVTPFRRIAGHGAPQRAQAPADASPRRLLTDTELARDGLIGMFVEHPGMDRRALILGETGQRLGERAGASPSASRSMADSSSAVGSRSEAARRSVARRSIAPRR